MNDLADYLRIFCKGNILGNWADTSLYEEFCMLYLPMAQYDLVTTYGVGDLI